MYTNSITLSLVFLGIWIVMALIWLVIWIMTLVHQAKRKRWGWFVLTLIFQITGLIYWIVWLISPKFRRKKAR